MTEEQKEKVIIEKASIKLYKSINVDIESSRFMRDQYWRLHDYCKKNDICIPHVDTDKYTQIVHAYVYTTFYAAITDAIIEGRIDINLIKPIETGGVIHETGKEMIINKNGTTIK